MERKEGEERADGTCRCWGEFSIRRYLAGRALALAGEPQCPQLQTYFRHSMFLSSQANTHTVPCSLLLSNSLAESDVVEAVEKQMGEGQNAFALGPSNGLRCNSATIYHYLSEPGHPRRDALSEGTQRTSAKFSAEAVQSDEAPHSLIPSRIPLRSLVNAQDPCLWLLAPRFLEREAEGNKLGHSYRLHS